MNSNQIFARLLIAILLLLGMQLNKLAYAEKADQDKPIILEAEKVWVKTKDIVSKGEIVKKIIGSRRFTNFPNKSFNSVAHVRPHATNAADTYPLATIDKLTNAKEYTKHCFWLNNNYVRDEIYLK
jgi:hypothetical protein